MLAALVARCAPPGHDANIDKKKQEHNAIPYNFLEVRRTTTFCENYYDMMVHIGSEDSRQKLMSVTRVNIGHLLRSS